MSVTIYHNPRCSTSRKTLALLEERGIKPKVVLYLDTPLDAAGIKSLLKKLNEAQLIAAIAKHPILLERPVVVNGAKAALARPPEKALEIL